MRRDPAPAEIDRWTDRQIDRQTGKVEPENSCPHFFQLPLLTPLLPTHLFQVPRSQGESSTTLLRRSWDTPPNPICLSTLPLSGVEMGPMHLPNAAEGEGGREWKPKRGQETPAMPSPVKVKGCPKPCTKPHRTPGQVRVRNSEF